MCGTPKEIFSDLAVIGYGEKERLERGGGIKGLVDGKLEKETQNQSLSGQKGWSLGQQVSNKDQGRSESHVKMRGDGGVRGA